MLEQLFRIQIKYPDCANADIDKTGTKEQIGELLDKTGPVWQLFNDPDFCELNLVELRPRSISISTVWEPVQKPARSICPIYRWSARVVVSRNGKRPRTYNLTIPAPSRSVAEFTIKHQYGNAKVEIEELKPIEIAAAFYSDTFDELPRLEFQKLRIPADL